MTGRGALDLGTNNCRLLIATPASHGFSVVDAFSRIVRLGEKLAQTGRLSEEAMSRTIDALRVCANKLRWRNVLDLFIIPNYPPPGPRERGNPSLVQRRVTIAAIIILE